MKRLMYWLRCLVLGAALGSSLVLAIQNASIFYGVECILLTVACILNIACGYGKKGEKK